MEWIRLQEVKSTQDWAKEHLSECHPREISLIVAEKQTAGYGRQGHSWLSDGSGNIYLTFVVPLPTDYQSIASTSLAFSLWTSQVLEKMGFHPTIKWPNDILIEGKKMGGVLCEVVSQGKNRVLLAGMGLNINLEEPTLNAIDQPATSLRAVSGEMHSPEQILEEISRCVERRLPLLFEKGFVFFLKEYEKFLIHRAGDKVSFASNAGHMDGRFSGITDEGAIRLRLPSGEEKAFWSGDIAKLKG